MKPETILDVEACYQNDIGNNYSPFDHFLHFDKACFFMIIAIDFAFGSRS
jgi:hypothetical protein